MKCELFSPNVQLTDILILLVAVAVNVITFTSGGSKLLTSPILPRTLRKVSPLLKIH